MPPTATSGTRPHYGSDGSHFVSDRVLAELVVPKINALRAHLAEFGVVAGVGRNGLERLLKVIEDDDRVPRPIWR